MTIKELLVNDKSQKNAAEGMLCVTALNINSTKRCERNKAFISEGVTNQCSQCIKDNEHLTVEIPIKYAHEWMVYLTYELIKNKRSKSDCE